MKALDIVKTPKGTIAMIKETNSDGSEASLIFFDNSTSEYNAWWDFSRFCWWRDKILGHVLLFFCICNLVFCRGYNVLWEILLKDAPYLVIFLKASSFFSLSIPKSIYQYLSDVSFNWSDNILFFFICQAFFNFFWI